MHSLLGRSPGSPAWPALYNPTIELFNVAHHPAVAPGASYLTEARDVFRFTFFWSLIFYLPLFGVCGFLAFLNILLAPAPHSRSRGRSRRRSWSRGNSGRKRSLSDADAASMHELDALALRSPVPGTPGARDALLLRPAPSNVSAAGASATLQQQEQQPTRTPPRVNPQRTRVVYALLVLLAYCAAGVLGAVIGAAVIGYVLAGLYEAGRFHLSTWMPPIFALVQALIGVLGVYPSVIEII